MRLLFALVTATCLAVSLLVSSCCCTRAFGSPRPVATDSTEPPHSDEALLVGEVKFDPPINPDDQWVSWHPSWRGRALLFDSETLQDPPNNGMAVLENYAIEASFNRQFIATVARRRVYLNWGAVVMRFSAEHQIPEILLLPTRLRVDIHPDDEAVYIGTLHYRLDKFSRVTSLKIDDDFADAQRDFSSRFQTVRLRKELATSVGLPAR